MLTRHMHANCDRYRDMLTRHMHANCDKYRGAHEHFLRRNDVSIGHCAPINRQQGIACSNQGPVCVCVCERERLSDGVYVVFIIDLISQYGAGAARIQDIPLRALLSNLTILSYVRKHSQPV